MKPKSLLSIVFMIPLKRISIILAILLPSYSFGQTFKDTLIYLTIKEAKIVNLSFNELERLESLNAQKDSIILLKSKRIENQEFIIQLRSDQLMAANLEIEKVKKEQKRLIVQNYALKIVSGVAILASLILLF